MMRKGQALKVGIFFIGTLCFIFSWQRGFTTSGGSPAGYSNAPGEGNCTSCHTGYTYSSPSAVIRLTVNSSNVLYYDPDSTYNIAIGVSKSGITKWGFEATALKDSDSTFVGSFAATSAPVAINNTAVFGKTRYYATQTLAGNAGTNGRSWSFVWKAPSTDVGKITFYVTAVAANADGASSGDQVFGRTFTFIPTPKVPIPGFIITPQSACIGDTVSLQDTSTRNPFAWSWTFNGANPPSSSVQNPKIVYGAAGTYDISLVATNSIGSCNTYTKKISVNAKPSDTVYKLRPPEFCQGDSTILRLYYADSYAWSNGATTQSITVKTSGNYQAVITSNGCSVKSNMVTVNAHPAPDVSLSRIAGADTVCSGDTLKFKLSTSQKKYSFFNNNKVLASSTNILTLTGLTGNQNNIYGMAYDALGCKSDTSTIYHQVISTRLPAPLVNAGSATTHSASVYWKPVTGAMKYEISIDSGKTWQYVGSDLLYTVNNMDPNTALAFMVRSLDTVPCGHGYTGTTTLNSLPCSKITYNVESDSLICPNAVATISFSHISPEHYSIFANGNATKKLEYNYFLDKDSTFQYSIYDSLEPNCPTRQVNVAVKLIRLADLQIASASNYYCGDNAPAVITGNGNFDEYDVYYNDSLAQAGASNIFSKSSYNDGDRIVMIGKFDGCRSDSSNTVIIHKYNAPQASFNYINQGKGNFDFINKSKSVKSQVWHFGDGTTDTSTSPSHTYQVNKIYTVWLVTTGAGGCVDSISKTLTATGIENDVESESLSIVPNPFNDKLTLSFQSLKPGYITVSIHDMQGETLKTFSKIRVTEGANTFQINAGGFRQGSYILEINNGTSIISRNIIRQ